MKRTAVATAITLLVLTCVISSGAWARAAPVRILLGSREAPVAPSPVFDGKRVLAPVTVLRCLGASHIASTDGKTIAVMASSGRSADIRTVLVDGTPMLPMDQVMNVIGGQSSWDADKNTLTLLAKLTSVEFVDDTLKINCSFPVAYTSGEWAGKVYVDVEGAVEDVEAQVIYVGGPVVERARPGQYAPTTARVALDLNKPTGYRFESRSPSSRILLKVADDLPKPVEPASVDTNAGKGRPFDIEGVSVQTMDQNGFEVVLATSSAGTAAVDYGAMPPQIVLKMPCGKLLDSVKQPDRLHPLLKALRFERLSRSGGARVEMDLARVMAYDIHVEDAAITVSVRTPDRSGGRLAGKLIVIDPGHGGPHDPGAARSGISEKSLNVKIADELVAALQKEGASTMLTRTGDYAVALSGRPAVAINNKADFFVSIHCNSTNPPDNRVSGIETYYHMDQASPKALAFAVQAGVCSHTGMCNIATRSDSKLYGGGLAVLRGLNDTDLPGVLVECGYVNHRSDRAKLVDAEYRRKVAAGIVAGLKAYVEGTPIK